MCYKKVKKKIKIIESHDAIQAQLAKGQIKSEWIYEIINFPKNEPKNVKDFGPIYYKNSQGRNP